MTDYGIDKLLPSDIRALDVWEQTEKRGQFELTFGVKFLDKALDGIIKSDIILLGAPTGAGKTELVANIARANTEKGKKVFFFALESDENEIEARMIYAKAASLFFKDPNRPRGLDVSFSSFYRGKIGDEFYPYFEQACKELSKPMQNQFVIYRGAESFDINRFLSNVAKIQHDADLVIIDHLHYFDLESDKENVEYTKIIKAIRDLSLRTSIPIILVAHLRKKDKNSSALMPDIDDFHGTSNISKIATKAILIAPKYSTDMSNQWETYMRPAKYRVQGTRTRFIGIARFDITTNTYVDDFVLGTISRDKKNREEFKAIEKDKWPTWAEDKTAQVWYPPPKVERPWNETDKDFDF